MEVTSLADQITHELQAAALRSPRPRQSVLGRILWSWPQNRALASASLPRQPRGQGRICGLISSPPWLLFSLQWRLALFPPPPVPVLISCGSCFPTDRAMKHWCGCHLDCPSYRNRPNKSWVKRAFSSQIRQQGEEILRDRKQFQEHTVNTLVVILLFF